MTKLRRNLFIALSTTITIAFLVLGATVFRLSYLRLGEAFMDLINSIGFYLSWIYDLYDLHRAPTVNMPSKYIGWNDFLPKDYEQFEVSSGEYIQLLTSKDNLKSWFVNVGEWLENTAMDFVNILPIIIAMFFIVKFIYNRHNTKHNKDTLPLKLYKGFSAMTIVPIVTFARQYKDFVKKNKALYRIWMLIWLFNLNIISIVIAFLAYYVYFSAMYVPSTLYIQACKLLIDLQMVIEIIPVWITIPLAIHIFNKVRQKWAMNTLQHFEARNCRFINELPIVSMTCGSMGKKKTTIITDMALSQEVMFRQKAFDIIQKNDMKFPKFPWICFEMQIKRCMQYGTIYNLASIKKWIALKRQRFEKHHNSNLQLYGYDYLRYGLTYDDKLKIHYLFDVLESYAQAYFIYIIESSLIVANYSIREDNTLIDGGNFPIWYSTFFPKDYLNSSRHSHILDFDVLRLGKKVIENNKNSGSFEFGIVVITEVGKERGNNLELKEVKKGTEETNQKNDLFNSWLKMCRHSSTVDNFPFIKVFTDEQRPESWGADARDLCDILNITGSSEQRLALKFYTIEDMLNEWLFNRFINMYYDLRYKRGDNTLLVYLVKSLTAFIYRRNIRIYNRYGYSVSWIEKERGTKDGKIDKKRYYLMNKKIYSDRFSTDCFSDYFNDIASKTKIGLNDYLEYAKTKASVEELKQQNSYFINSLYKNSSQNDN